ncbi:MAG TPA: TRAP transporter small permease [Burkholderiaceae bacterium]
MERIADLYCKVLCALMALALFVMVVLVFGNVVLRYAFNSGITVSEELGRWLFVWVTFMGAVVALREHAHLGTDALVARLPPRGKKVCLVVGHLIMIYICWLIYQGSMAQTKINMEVLAPSSQLPLAIVYAAGVFFAVSGGVMLLLDLWLLFTGRVADDKLVMIQESEDAAALQHATHDAPKPR